MYLFFLLGAAEVTESDEVNNPRRQTSQIGRFHEVH